MRTLVTWLNKMAKWTSIAYKIKFFCIHCIMSGYHSPRLHSLSYLNKQDFYSLLLSCPTISRHVVPLDLGYPQYELVSVTLHYFKPSHALFRLPCEVFGPLPARKMNIPGSYFILSLTLISLDLSVKQRRFAYGVTFSLHTVSSRKS